MGWATGPMLTRFYIRNFRCFPELELDGLARVNLITGGNNTGKTTLLEALVLHSEETGNSTMQGLGRLFRPTYGEGPEFWQWLIPNKLARGVVDFASLGAFEPLRDFLKRL